MTDCHYLIRLAEALLSTQRELCVQLHNLVVCHTHLPKLRSEQASSTHHYNLPVHSQAFLTMPLPPPPGPKMLAETPKGQRQGLH